MHLAHGIILAKAKDYLPPEEKNTSEIQKNVLKVRTLPNMHGL